MDVFLDKFHWFLSLVDQMENADGEDEAECGEAELRQKVEVLKQELRECRAELSKLQKQLSHSERLQKSTESYNEDLRKQVGREKWRRTEKSYSMQVFVVFVLPTKQIRTTGFRLTS